MGTSMSHHKPKRQRGFTLIETLAAILVLTIGLVGLAVLMSNMMTGGARSRYMSEAAMLASEKLEDLERYPAADPDVAVTSGATAGTLQATSRPALLPTAPRTTWIISTPFNCPPPEGPFQRLLLAGRFGQHQLHDHQSFAIRRGDGQYDVERAYADCGHAGVQTALDD